MRRRGWPSWWLGTDGGKDEEQSGGWWGVAWWGEVGVGRSRGGEGEAVEGGEGR